ncbi:hypothetical protein O181_017528 [Austropuccinia psidii MF-1]|uniref:Uncharacterized protein n=1 Tax=Austropuccinia psidii MF-1 TaxID=1389203 RepID=A0A9Q3C686_9BASI|nr:hypothetical protein [Austropuccinia psidii MF-1]
MVHHTKFPTSNRRINEEFSQHLPSSIDQIFLCPRNFITIVLGISPLGSPLPGPLPEKLISNSIQPTIEELASNEACFEISSSDTSYCGERKGITGIHRDKFTAELFNYGIENVSVQLKIKTITTRDNIIFGVIKQQWLHALTIGYFRNYALDPSQCQPERVMGISECFLREKKDNFRNPKIPRKTRKKPHVR